MKFCPDFSSLAVAALFVFSSVSVRADQVQVSPGSTVMLSVTADGTAPFTYQWKKDGVNLTGFTDPTLTIASVQSANAGSYQVLVANSAGSTTSDIAAITIVAAPVITTQPLSQDATAGTNVTFIAAASGIPAPTFQWQRNGINIPGETNATLTLNGVSTAAAGTYTFVATNSVSSVASTGAVLTVDGTPVIATQPLSQSVLIGTNVTFTVVANGTPAPTFQWKKNGTNISGATNASLTLSAVTMSTAGTYTVVATSGAKSVTSTDAVLTVATTNSAPVITTQPQSQGVTVGASAMFAVVANGTPTPAFQWKKNGVNIGGATGNSYSITTVTEGDFGIYTVVVSNSIGSVVSNACFLSANVAANGDFDGDGKTDTIWTNTITGDRVMWLMNGTKISSNAYLGTVPLAWSITGTGDFDGDGKADIFWTNTLTGDRAMWLMNGSTIKSGAYLGAVPVAWSVSGIGDFDGDHKADIFWTNRLTGERAVWLMNGGVVGSGASLGVTPLAWTVSGTGDFNGDGKSDVVLSNSVTGDRVMWLMNGLAVSSNVYLGTVPTAWSITGTSDFDGDGKADIFWTNTLTGDRAMWLMNGGTAKSGAYLGNVSLVWVSAGIGDFDGDGKADIFWTNILTGDRAMWLMNGGTAKSGAVLGVVPLEWSSSY